MKDSNVYKKIGHRIRMAREKADLLQEQVAEKLGYNSVATISHFEKGIRKISVIDLQKLAELLDVPISYFFNTDDMEQETPHVEVVFRAKGLIPTLHSQLETFVQFAERRATKPHIDHAAPNKEQSGWAGKIARHYLDKCGVNNAPIHTRQIAKFLNIPVFDWTLPENISGLTLFSDDCVCIGVNDQHPNVRQRFSIAHELGHIILHPPRSGKREVFVGIEFNDNEAGKLWGNENDTESQLEREANWFAADLLMPKHLLQKEYQGNNQQQLEALARKYDVSMQAMWIQIESLKLAR